MQSGHKNSLLTAYYIRVKSGTFLRIGKYLILTGESGMRKVQAEDVAVIACPTERIWRTIIDFNSYTKWWPASVRIVVRRVTPELVGAQVEIKPYGGRAFLCEVESIRDGVELRLRYSGVYRGIGVWTIAESGSGSRVV